MIDVYTDGATVGHNGKLGTVTQVGLGIYIPLASIRESRLCNGISSNEAEFMALIEAMKICIDKKILSCRFNLDSEIVTNRAKGKHKKLKYRNERMDKFQGEVLQLACYFKDVEFNWIPREHNEEADRLSKELII